MNVGTIREAAGIRVFAPLVVLALYSVFFSWFLSWLLPDDRGVNAVFAAAAWRFALLVAGLYVIILVLRPVYRRYFLAGRREGHDGDGPYFWRKAKERMSLFRDRIDKLDFVLVLLPLTPVVQYLLNNQDILTLLGWIYVLAVFAVFSALLIIIVPTLLSFTGSTKTLMILGMAFAFTVTNMAALSSAFHWLEAGNFAVQVAFLGAVFVVCWILYKLVDRRLLYLAVVILFVANTALQLSPTESESTGVPDEGNRLVELIGSRKPVSKPNIYLMVYDSYVANETMLGYGIDNEAQEEYLDALGFTLYPHTYSVGANSLSTMSRTLNASAQYYGDARRGVSGDGIVHNLLKSFGYETYGIFEDDYFFRGIGTSYGFSYPEASTSPEGSSCHELLVKGIFMGEFRFDLDFAFDETTHEQFVGRKLSVLENVPERPRFIYMHCSLPSHSQNSGTCRPNETALFYQRLTQANREMKQDIETLFRKDPDAVIIVAGDHGPALTKNCYETGGEYDISEMARLDIQDRYGTFLAIRWPTQDFGEYDDITVIQDVFPAVFSYLFEDAGLLEAKVPSATLQYEKAVSGVMVENGIIHGGIDDGEPLFVSQRNSVE